GISAEKLDQDEVITMLVRVRSDAVFVRKTLVDRFSVKIGDLTLAIAEGCKRSGAQSDAQGYDKEQDPFHDWSIRLCSTLSGVVGSYPHCAKAGASCRVQKTTNLRRVRPATSDHAV